MKVLITTVLTLSLAGFSSVTNAGKAPEKLADVWTVHYVSQPPSLGLAVGDKIRIGSEFWGRDQFDLNIKLNEGSEHARQLGKATLFLAQDPKGQDNLITKKDACDFSKGLGFRFLEVFDRLVREGPVKTYVYGVGYLGHEGSEHDAKPHMIVSLSYKIDPKDVTRPECLLPPDGKRGYLLAVIALGKREKVAMHNGVIHGWP